MQNKYNAHAEGSNGDRSRAGRIWTTLLGIGLAAMSAGSVAGQAFNVTNLKSDGSVPAATTDPNFLNPWGVSASPNWWISASRQRI